MGSGASGRDAGFRIGPLVTLEHSIRAWKISGFVVVVWGSDSRSRYCQHVTVVVNEVENLISGVISGANKKLIEEIESVKSEIRDMVV